jgi:predicted Zn-dependent protease
MKAKWVRVVASFCVGAALLLTMAGCATVPVTGRKQLSLVSAAQETQLGLASFQEMKQQIPLSRDAAAQALVEKVGRRIATVASKDLPNAQWEFVVFDSKEMNAFCLPGGKVGVYTGLLAITQDEAGLATVLGHEVAHAAAHHGGERMSEAMLLQTGQQILGASLSTRDPGVQQAALVAFGLGAQLGRELPHSRKQEAEADEIGLIYMARSGYDPRKALDFWQRFSHATSGGDSTPWFLRTHPVTTDRIAHIQELLPRAEAQFRRSVVPVGR